MAEFINTADVIGDDELCDQIIMRTVTEYADNWVTKVGQYAFYKCTALARVDVPAATKIEANAFNGCTALSVFILRSTSMCTLNADIPGPIKDGTGYIYVPRALVDSYKAATNWSTYDTQFRALEDYTVDGTITGELDETKI